VSQFWNQNFTFFAASAGDESDMATLVDIFRHRHPIVDGLIIWMGVNEKQSWL
jgi:hypothetical protein